MIYVTCGHEKGIGLEVFLKSYLTLLPEQHSSFTLICHKEYLQKECENLKLPFEHCKNKSQVKIANKMLNIVHVNDSPISTSALEYSIKNIKSSDVLVTMPTSKDKIIFENQNLAGHTEYFRKVYNKNVSMFFKSNEANVLLISDHVSVAELKNYLSTDLLYSQIKTTIDDYRKYFGNLKRVYTAGLNPHAGEDGILGTEELTLREALKKLKQEYAEIEFSDFIPADSMLINNPFSDDSLFVYMYHDQGLAPFKTLFKTYGANISLGLPFLRLSVDHGTAFNLYGKNEADYLGRLYVLKLALTAQRSINEKQ